MRISKENLVLNIMIGMLCIGRLASTATAQLSAKQLAAAGSWAGAKNLRSP